MKTGPGAPKKVERGWYSGLPSILLPVIALGLSFVGEATAVAVQSLLLFFSSLVDRTAHPFLSNT